MKVKILILIFLLLSIPVFGAKMIIERRITQTTSNNVTDVWVNESGDTITGDLTINADLLVSGNQDFTPGVSFDTGNNYDSPIEYDSGGTEKLWNAWYDNGVGWLTFYFYPTNSFTYDLLFTTYNENYGSCYHLNDIESYLDMKCYSWNSRMKIIDLETPTDDYDAANKLYVDTSDDTGGWVNTTTRTNTTLNITIDQEINFTNGKTWSIGNNESSIQWNGSALILKVS